MDGPDPSPSWVFRLRQSVIDILKMPRMGAERRPQKEIINDNPFEFHRLPVLNGVETLYLLKKLRQEHGDFQTSTSFQDTDGNTFIICIHPHPYYGYTKPTRPDLLPPNGVVCVLWIDAKEGRQWLDHRDAGIPNTAAEANRFITPSFRKPGKEKVEEWETITIEDKETSLQEGDWVFVDTHNL